MESLSPDEQDRLFEGESEPGNKDSKPRSRVEVERPTERRRRTEAASRAGLRCGIRHVGTQRRGDMAIEGSELDDVVKAIDFLMNVNHCYRVKLGKQLSSAIRPMEDILKSGQIQRARAEQRLLAPLNPELAKDLSQLLAK